MDIYVNSLLAFLLLAVHHWARSMFCTLPLHNETGLYVSNDTILNRRINPRKSWHARYSGGSQIVPEFFFSLVYLCSSGRKYAYFWRLFYAILTMLLFPPIAIICAKLGMGKVEIWITMFFLALVLAEPQFGSYYESGEQFELFPMVWGLMLLMIGVDNNSALMVAGALLLWILSAFFIKFSFIVTPFVFSIQLLKAGEAFSTIALTWLAGIAAYVLWLVLLQCNPVRVVAGAAHQLLGGNRLFSRQTLLLLYAKFQQMLDVFGQNLPMLLVAAYGFFRASADTATAFHYVFLLTTCALISYFLKGAPASYQTLPLVPPLVIWAGYGILLLRAGPFTFWTAFAWLALLSYYVVFFLRPRLMKPLEFVRWVWRGRPLNVAESEVMKDHVLLTDLDRIKAKTFDFSVFLAGPHTQMQVLLQTAYPTTFVCAAPWLDALEPNWQRELVEQFRVYPAPYILDTAECFSLAQASRWGLNYQLLDENPGVWRLYGHKAEQSKWKGQEGTPEIFDFTGYFAAQA